ncbi:hypothetical protein K5D42_25360 [Pseudomonas cichorii]|nr:hypothetical protein [Pseudomonas cichorii]MBX8493202.1 hypothetical protein [Pseudomonas cichorii]
MKPSKNVSDLAATLSAAASAPLVARAAAPTVTQPPKKASVEGGTVQLTLRPTKSLLAIYVNKAAERSKLEGRTVSAQEIMLERLAEGEEV